MGESALAIREVLLAEHEPGVAHGDFVTLREFQFPGQRPSVDERAVGALHVQDDVAAIRPANLRVLAADLVVHDLGGAALVAADDERAPAERVVVAGVGTGGDGE